jgi:hypothetical protein
MDEYIKYGPVINLFMDCTPIPLLVNPLEGTAWCDILSNTYGPNKFEELDFHLLT